MSDTYAAMSYAVGGYLSGWVCFTGELVMMRYVVRVAGKPVPAMSMLLRK